MTTGFAATDRVAEPHEAGCPQLIVLLASKEPLEHVSVKVSIEKGSKTASPDEVEPVVCLSSA